MGRTGLPVTIEGSVKPVQIAGGLGAIQNHIHRNGFENIIHGNRNESSAQGFKALKGFLMVLADFPVEVQIFQFIRHANAHTF